MDKVADWVDDHPMVALPATIVGMFEGRESPALEEDGALVEARVTSVAELIEEWLGPNFRKLKSETSDLRLASADGTRQIRFDITDPHGLDPHVNLELWKMRNLYPGDVRWDNLKNIHVYFKGTGKE